MARVRFLDQVPVGFYDTNNGGGGTGAGFPYSGSAVITGSLLISGSGLTVTGSINADNITGSLFGTASWAQNAYSSQNTQDVLINVLNQSGNSIAKGVVVRITGSNNSSDIPRIVTASYENDNNSANTLGITNQSIAQGATGSVITEGILLGINTSNFTSGQLIYLGATGSIIGYAPIAPLHAVRLGEVIRSQTNNGSIYVRIDNGYELDELHNVLITSPSSSGDLLMLSGSVWTNSKILTGSYTLSGSLTTNDGVRVQSLTASFISASQITGSLFGTASYALSAKPAGSNTEIQFNSASVFSSSPSFTYIISTDSLQQGDGVTALGINSHAEGVETIASGLASHAEGTGTQAIGDYSHAEGFSTIASGSYQHVQGQFNIPSSAQSAFIVGNGTDINNRSNLIFASDSQVQITGSLRVSGSITGSLFGTASNAITSQTASFLPVGTYTITASWAQSAITSQTASFISTSSTNAFVQGGNSFGVATAMLGNNDNSNLAIETNGSTRIYIDKGGNIGIGSGNATPTQTLYVQGSSAESGDVFAVANSTPTTLFTIQNAGNVGIGINNPTSKLHVSGGLLLTGSGLNAPLILSDGNYIYGGGVQNNTNIIFGLTSTQTELYARNNRIGIWGPGGGINYLYSVNGNFGIGIGAIPPQARLHISGSSSQPLLIVSSSIGPALFVSGSGNVGIGTSTPAYTLDVNGTARVQNISYIGPSQLRPFGSSIAVDPTGGNLAIIPSNATNTLVDSTGAVFIRSNTVATTANLFTLCSIQTIFSPTSGTGVNNNLTIHPTINQTGGANGITRGLYINPTLISASDFRAIETTAGNVLFQSGSTPLLFVSSSGNVGIGTNNPTSSLHIVGTTTAQSIVPTAHNTYDIGTNSIRFKNIWSNNLVVAPSGVFNNIFFGVTDLGIFNSTSAQVGRWFGNGNLLVGSSSIDNGYRLQVIDSGSVSGSVFISGSISQPLLIASSSAGTALFVSGSGRVGIGTSTPLYTLDVSGSIRIPNNTGLYINTSTNNPIQVLNSDAGNNLVFKTTSSGDIYFYEGNSNILGRFVNGGNIHLGGTSAANSPVLRIITTGGGRVGIGLGTSIPSQALEVNGGAIISGSVNVRSSAGIGIFDSSGYGGGRIFSGFNYLNGEVYINPAGSGVAYGTVFSPNNGVAIGGFTIGGTVGSPPSYGLAVSGSVGIGTRIPSASLHISGGNMILEGSMSFSDPAKTISGLVGSTFTIKSTNNSIDIQAGSSNTIRVNSAAGRLLLIPTTYGASFPTDNTYRTQIYSNTPDTGALYISSSNVAINVDTPGNTNLLYISGSQVAIGSTTQTGARFYVNGSISQPLLIVSSSAGTALFVSGSGNVGIGTSTPSASLHISGSTTNLLQIDAPGSSNILFVSGSGNVGIGTATPGVKLDVAGTIRTSGTVFNSTTQTQIIQINSGVSALRFFSGSVETARYDGNNWGFYTTTPTARLQVKGSGATSATTTLLIQNSTPTNLLSVLDNGQFIIGSPTMSIAASQSAFSINHQISASNVVGGQYYGINYTPTFYQTTASQTETAFRIAATFTQSSAAATSGSNIIADFGAVNVGSQLTVTDVTSGSIYMVNDVSGLPIIEATSDWSVNMYNYPNIVFRKTGSSILITGSLNVTGSLNMSPTSSFVLPLTSSASPQTGSAFWSGSFLYVYDGTRYRSSSFA